MKQKVFAFILTLIMVLGIVPCVGAAATLPEGVPASLESAAINQIQVLKDEDSIPYFQMEVKFPQSFIDLNEACPAGGEAWIDYYWKIDNGSWEYLGGGATAILLDESYGNAVSGKTNVYNVSYIYPEDEGNTQAIIIKDHTYTIRAQLAYRYYYDSADENLDTLYQFVYSSFSNEVSIGSGSFYKKASDWAKPELQKADDLSLIPNILKGADMTAPITREEFCELAVLLYEKTTGIQSSPASPNPFTDTVNPQILKAYKLGITAGTSETNFSPNLLINREQCATMLFRAINDIKPDGSFDIAGVKDFPDQKYISSWALQATKYMFKTSIIAGDSNGNFMPKATTTAQEAAGYGMATREQAVAMSVRTYEKLPTLL
ncbi:MAG: S-layer homology domain-containing protein [Lachnospiraceae bacterium]|nr:S-layer homology domain-containing protein [Lachnospiraceae bacterium]